MKSTSKRNEKIKEVAAILRAWHLCNKLDFDKMAAHIVTALEQKANE